MRHGGEPARRFERQELVGESANTTRPSPEHSIAPVHMLQGWQLVYIVVPAAASAASSRAAHLASFSSGWAEMSASVSEVTAASR